jgi:UDP-N-acetylenolpyruvoylglucosamine reductase
MNAGAYGREIERRDCSRAEAIDATGRTPPTRDERRDWVSRYRHCGVPADWIFVAGRTDEAERRAIPAAIAGAHRRDPGRARSQPQPIRSAHRRLDLRQSRPGRAKRLGARSTRPAAAA